MKNDYQQYIFKSRYARYLPEEGRRETWEETVGRYIAFMVSKHRVLGDTFDGTQTDIPANVLKDSILNQEVMPSMRALMTAGKALERDHVAGYNCAYLPIDHPRAFDEAMYILLCGTGVGFSVERQSINKLPEVSEEFYETDTTISVADSKIGWASALRELISLLYAGKEPKYDLSKVRPAGSRLKTFGGRASGPGPLEALFKNAIRIFRGAAGRKLNSLECHDLMCYIADAVVVGGVRRSACISLSNLTDDRMRRAKTGSWFLETENPQRGLANNSVAYTEKPDLESFMKEWKTLYKSKVGERGIINRTAFQKKAKAIGRDPDHEFGVNPCGEIILRPFQFCNLTEVIVRPEDTLDDLKRKVAHATILGTLQATLTDFRYLRKIWKRNCEEEALLGVSFTGIMDNKGMCEVRDGYSSHKEYTLPYILRELKQIAIETNKVWADKLGINKAAAITCVKPSGTVSQLVNSSSGIHPRHYKYFIRTVRNDKKDPLAQFLVEQGVPYVEDDNDYLFRFPMKAPSHSITQDEIGAIEQLKLWKIYADHWCDHNPSQSILYTDDDFLEVGAWVWKNFDSIGGLSFFPHNDHVLENSPYMPITEEEYQERKEGFPDVNWEDFNETEDTTTGSQEYACVSGQCDI